MNVTILAIEFVSDVKPRHRHRHPHSYEKQILRGGGVNCKMEGQINKTNINNSSVNVLDDEKHSNVVADSINDTKL